MMNAIAFVLCTIGAVLKAIDRDWGWVAIDATCAVVNAEPAYRWWMNRKAK